MARRERLQAFDLGDVSHVDLRITFCVPASHAAPGPVPSRSAYNSARHPIEEESHAPQRDVAALTAALSLALTACGGSEPEAAATPKPNPPGGPSGPHSGPTTTPRPVPQAADGEERRADRRRPGARDRGRPRSSSTTSSGCPPPWPRLTSTVTVVSQGSGGYLSFDLGTGGTGQLTNNGSTSDRRVAGGGGDPFCPASTSANRPPAVPPPRVRPCRRPVRTVRPSGSSLSTSTLRYSAVVVPSSSALGYWRWMTLTRQEFSAQ